MHEITIAGFNLEVQRTWSSISRSRSLAGRVRQDISIPGFFLALSKQPGEFVEFFLGVGAEVFSFGQELADESVGVFIDSALPGRVRVG